MRLYTVTRRNGVKEDTRIRAFRERSESSPGLDQIPGGGQTKGDTGSAVGVLRKRTAGDA